MSIPALEWSRRLRAVGVVMRRDGLSQRAAKIMVEVVTKSGSYKEAMIAAGRLKAICSAAKYDDYWTEQVDKGFHAEMAELERLASAVADTNADAPGNVGLLGGVSTDQTSLNITGLDTGAVKTAESEHSPSTLNAETE